MKRSPLRLISERQKKRTKEWTRVTRARAASVEYICEAHIPGVCDGYGLHGHHVIRRSQATNDTFENCRWLCKSCHRWVHSHPAMAMSRGLLSSAPHRPHALATHGAAAPDASPWPHGGVSVRGGFTEEEA